MPNKKIRIVNYNGTSYDINADAANSASTAGYAEEAGALAVSVMIDGVQFDGSRDIVHFANCSTNGNVANKTVNLTGFTSASLVNGARIAVKFANTNTAVDAPTLNVSGTGAKTIWYAGAAIAANKIVAGQVCEFIYDATNQVWQYVGSIGSAEGEIIEYSPATTTSDGLMSAADKTKLDSLLDMYSLTGNSPISVNTSSTEVTVSHNKTNNNLTQNYSRGDTTNQAPAFGGTFKALAGTIDPYGHVQEFTEHTVTIPATTATTSAPGLMSSADKTKLDDVITIAGQSVGLGDSISASTLKQALNLSTAMRFIGKTSTTMTGAALSSPIIVIEGDSRTAENGDVVIETSTNYEYVWVASGENTGTWEVLGPGGSYALSNHTHDNATTSAAGFMSADDKDKLESIDNGAEVNVLESITLTTSGGVNVDNNGKFIITNKNINLPVMTGASESAGGAPGFAPSPSAGQQNLFLKGDGTWASPANTTYNTATTTTDGLMSAEDKDKLDGIDTGATRTVISATSPIVASGQTGNVTISHADSTVTSGSYGVTPTGTPNTLTVDFGENFSLPGFTVDSQGHVLAAKTQIVTISNREASESQSGLMSAAMVTQLNNTTAGLTGGTVTRITAGTGLTGGAITTSGTIGLNLKDNKTFSEDGVNLPDTLSVQGRVYNLRPDHSGYLGVYVPWENTTYQTASASTDGLMSSNDWSKLNSIEMNATATTISYTPTLTSGQKIGTITINGTNNDLYTAAAMTGASASAAGTAGYIGTAPTAAQNEYYWAGDGTWKGEPSSNNELGLFTNAEKTKLSAIDTEATKIALKASDPIVLTDETNHTISNSSWATGNVIVTHKTSTASGTYGTTATTALTPMFGETVTVPGFTVDGYGHISAAGAHTVKMPEIEAGTSINGTQVHGLMSLSDKSKLDGIDVGATHIESVSGTPPITAGISNTGVITVSHDQPVTNYSGTTYGSSSNATIEKVQNQDKYKLLVPYVTTNNTGHVSAGGTHETYIPLASTSSDGLLDATSFSKLYDMVAINDLDGDGPITVTENASNEWIIGHTNSGVISQADLNNNVTTVTKGNASNAQLDFNQNRSFKVLNATVNKYGLVTALDEKTITIPNDVATTTADGLMSSADKNKLDEFDFASSYATIDVVDDRIAALASPMVFKGTISSASGFPNNPEEGWMYVVSSGGWSYGGETIETGSMFIYTAQNGWVNVKTDKDGALYKDPDLLFPTANFSTYVLQPTSYFGEVAATPINPSITFDYVGANTYPTAALSIAGVAFNEDLTDIYATTGRYGITQLTNSASDLTVNNLATTPLGVKNIIDLLDVTNNVNDTHHIVSTDAMAAGTTAPLDASKTLAALTQTDGYISAKFQPIEISTEQITSGSPLPMTLGGTGVDGFDDYYRIIYPADLGSLGEGVLNSSNHYVDDTKLVLNTASTTTNAQNSALTDTLTVNGTSNFIGDISVKNTIIGIGNDTDPVNDPISHFEITTNANSLDIINSTSSGQIYLNTSVTNNNNTVNTNLTIGNNAVQFGIPDATSLVVSTLGNIPIITNALNTLANFPLVSTGDNRFTLDGDIVMDGADMTIGDGTATPASGTLTVGVSITAPTINATTGFVGDLTGNADTATAADISTTANSVAFYTNTTGTFGYKASANGALYSTSADGALQWGTLPVPQGGTGMTSTSTNNAVVIGNSSNTSGAMQTIQTKNGAFYATSTNGKPQFGTLPVAQGGTGVTSIANIQAGKDGAGNTITTTYATKAEASTIAYNTTTHQLTQTVNSVTSNVIGLNSATSDGFVQAPDPNDNINKLWGTDENGDPGWIDIPEDPAAAPIEEFFTLYPASYVGTLGSNEAQWNGSTITIYNENVTDDSLQIVSPAQYEYSSGYFMSEDEVGALGSALIIDGGQSGPVGGSQGYFVLRALGAVPTEITHIRVLFKYTTEDGTAAMESAAASAAAAEAAVNQIGAKAMMARKTVTFSSTTSDAGNTTYPYKYEVSINGVAANDWVDGSGVTDQDWAIESVNNKVILHFSKAITTSTTINIYWCSCYDLDNA